MAYRQKITPNVSIRGFRGWCLKYVDDAVNAPRRTATAKAAYLNVRDAGRLHKSALPLNVWVVVYFSLAGYYAPYGHVALAKRRSDGSVLIYDSEVAAGARRPYTSLYQLLAWFGRYAPKYLGWSTHVDGAQVAESYTPKPSGRRARSGRATVTVTKLNVRSSPNTKNAPVAAYKRGEAFNYDSFIDAAGYRWLSYRSYSGKRRYIAQGKGSTKFVKGGVA